MSGNVLVVASTLGRNANLPSVMTVVDNNGTASFSLNATGLYSSQGSSQSVSGQWIRGSGAGASYEARATVVSGSPSGTTNTWLALSSNRTWSVTSGGVSVTASLTIEIRDAASLTVYTTASLSLDARLV